MSLAITLNNALSALQTNQSALQVISNNIANVNTAEYSRKVYEQQTRVVGGQGSGVETARVIRQVETHLVTDLVKQTSDTAKAQVLSDYQARIQETYGSVANNNSLSTSITNLATAIENAANTPEITATLSTAVSEAVALANHINSTADEVQALRSQADTEIEAAVDLVNTHLTAIAELNEAISRNLSQDIPIGDLEDQRDTSLKIIAENLGVTSFVNSENHLTVVTKGGRSLISGATAATVSYTPTTAITAGQTYPTAISGIYVNDDGSGLAANDITASINTGKIAGLVEMRDETLPAMTGQLDQLAAAIRDQLNQVHNRGANTLSGSGTAAGDPATLYGTREITAPGDTLTLSDDVTLQILDSDGAPATTELTISAGTTSPDDILTVIANYLNSGIDFGEAAWVDDRMEIKLENGYSLAILDNGPEADKGDATITIDADGDSTAEEYKGFSHFFGLNDLFQTPNQSGTGMATANQGEQTGISSTIEVRADIAANPEYLSRGALNGTSPDYYVGNGDGRIAQDLAAAFAENINFDAVANGPANATTTLSGYATTMLSFSAANAASAQNTLEFESFTYQSLETKVLSYSGVNLDEELANMVIFQNAYNASARVIQTANELFDQLLNL